jgi:ferric-dicitrate binding protein FerR (iron transport regulator)
MAYENDTNQHIVLISGSVRVHSGDNAETVLSPNEMYISENGNSHVEKVNVEYFTSWKTGMYQYKSERLEVIMKRLSRYYGKDISCMPEVAHLKCSGKLDLKDDLNSVLRGISHTAPVNYQFDNDRRPLFY